jgi:hypothetical protein
LKRFEKFKTWIKENSYRRGIICHFYIAEREKKSEVTKKGKSKQKQYYTKADYAFFNMLSDVNHWIVKGTIHHGVKDKYGDLCRIPCLNCFEVNKKFFKALRQLGEMGNDKFELGVLFNKRKLRNRYEIRDVDEWDYHPLPNKQCWGYDIFSKRRKVLEPFNFCDVVRVKIPKGDLRGLPIELLPIDIVMGLLVRKEDYQVVRDLPKVNENDLEVFPLL